MLLTHGAYEVELAPVAGGSIARFDILRDGSRLPLMRPASPEAMTEASARSMGCYPLVPYSNRIERGWHGLQPNHPSFPLPIHGEGWLKPWTVVAHDRRGATLAHTHEGTDGWPWAYSAEQQFALSDEGLAVRIAVTNRSDRPMPAGIGLHPYFHRTPAARIRAATASVWLNDKNMLPTERVPLPDSWRLDPMRLVEGLALDNCFEQWDGRAEILWPDRRLGLSLEATAPLRHLVVYTPAGRDFFCLEPVSHCNNGFALAERGVRDTGSVLLAPGDTLAAAIRFRPSQVTTTAAPA